MGRIHNATTLTKEEIDMTAMELLEVLRKKSLPIWHVKEVLSRAVHLIDLTEFK